jgi:hypothetical protein
MTAAPQQYTPDHDGYYDPPLCLHCHRPTYAHWEVVSLSGDRFTLLCKPTPATPSPLQGDSL